ncbi:MAG: hypothetical protein ACOX1Y_05365 [Zhaonellaceae bacterium]|jgi:hypothetical protein
MSEVIFDGTCQIIPDEKQELDLPESKPNILARPKENCSQNKIEL